MAKSKEDKMIKVKLTAYVRYKGETYPKGKTIEIPVEDYPKFERTKVIEIEEKEEDIGDGKEGDKKPGENEE